MKKPITIALALLAFASVAQYNNTYDVNGNNDFLEPSFVITNNKAESFALSIAYDAPGVPRTDYFIITKHACDGKVIYNNRIYPNNSTTDGITNVEALIATDDGGMFIAGYHYDDDRHIEQPMLVKVDGAGNLAGTTHIYYVNQQSIANSQINKISLCRVFDDEEENYFIVASGDSDHNPGNDVVTNVIKVNNNGDMMWSYKYYTNDEGHEFKREYPGDIDFSPKRRAYMIAGYRYVVYPDKENTMYFLEIDKNGSFIDFRTLYSKSVPIDQDMVYDKKMDRFAVTFTHEKDGYVPGTSSVIGFIQVDPAMNFYNPKYIWHSQGASHNGRSISLCASSNEYVIGAGIYDPDMGINNPSLVKVDNTGVPSWFARYNINDDAYFGHHATTFNCFDKKAEEYVMVNEQNTDLRMIRPNVIGNVCGAVYYDPRVEKYETKDKRYECQIEKQGKYVAYDPYQKEWKPKARACKEPGESYRTANVTTGVAQINNADNAVAMYPSVISLDNARLTMENNSDASVKIEMYNIAGQLILSNNQIATGKSEVELNANGNLSQGIYLLKVYDAKGTLATTTKLVITK